MLQTRTHKKSLFTRNFRVLWWSSIAFWWHEYWNRSQWLPLMSPLLLLPTASHHSLSLPPHEMDLYYSHRRHNMMKVSLQRDNLMQSIGISALMQSMLNPLTAMMFLWGAYSAEWIDCTDREREIGRRWRNGGGRYFFVVFRVIDFGWIFFVIVSTNSNEIRFKFWWSYIRTNRAARPLIVIRWGRFVVDCRA